MQYPDCENPSIQNTSGRTQYRYLFHNREFHNVNCRFCGAIHDVDWANISVLSQVIRNVNERKTVQTKYDVSVRRAFRWASEQQSCSAEASMIVRIPAPWLTKEIIFVCTVFLSFTLCVQRSWTTLAGVSPVTVIASEPCS